MPDQVDEVELLGDLIGRPGAASRPPDDLEARVDPAHVLLQVCARDRSGHDVLEGQSFRELLSRRHIEFLDELAVIHLSSSASDKRDDGYRLWPVGTPG